MPVVISLGKTIHPSPAFPVEWLLIELEEIAAQYRQCFSQHDPTTMNSIQNNRSVCDDRGWVPHLLVEAGLDLEHVLAWYLHVLVERATSSEAATTHHLTMIMTTHNRNNVNNIMTTSCCDYLSSIVVLCKRSDCVRLPPQFAAVHAAFCKWLPLHAPRTSDIIKYHCVSPPVTVNLPTMMKTKRKDGFVDRWPGDSPLIKSFHTCRPMITVISGYGVYIRITAFLMHVT
jgi:hypothetical protein